GGKLAQYAGIADEDIKLAPAFMDGHTEPVEGGKILDVGRHQSGRAAHRLDLVIEFLEPALSAGEGDDMGAFPGEAERGIFADAARRTGDDRDAVGKLSGH